MANITIFNGHSKRVGIIEIDLLPTRKSHLGQLLLDITVGIGKRERTVEVAVKPPDRFWRDSYAYIRWKDRSLLTRHGILKGL